MIATLYWVAGAFLSELSFLARPPCQEDSNLANIAWLALPFALMLSFWLQLKAFKKPRYLVVTMAVLIPIAAWSAHALARQWNTSQQKQCEVRPLGEAMHVCRANAAVYREGRDQHGYTTMTLIAPGTTDKAFACLERWALWNGAVTFKIDESVYRAYRRRSLER